MAAGVVLAEGVRPAEQADHIRRLVERALADAPTNAVAVAPEERFEALKRLAFNLTDSGGERDGLDFRTRNVVRETTLVRSRLTGACEFSLPIFQQWFAAQAMLSDPGRCGGALRGTGDVRPVALGHSRCVSRCRSESTRRTSSRLLSGECRRRGLGAATSL